MEKAVWNGKLFLASDVAEDFQLENKIRKASGHKELKCPDPNCGNPIVRYCHGDEKDAYFAHLNNECCDYARYDKDTLPIIKTIKTKLFHSLQHKGFHIDIDVKILTHHYTPLIIETENAGKIAIEFGTKQTSANTTSFLSEQYANVGILLRWIVVDDHLTLWNESAVCHIKRFVLNTSKNRDLIIISKDGECVKQSIEDQNRYEYGGREIRSSNYPAFFCKEATIDDITLEDTELTTINFYKFFEMWLLTKRRKFEERVLELQEEERLAEERRQKYQEQMRLAELERQRRQEEMRAEQLERRKRQEEMRAEQLKRQRQQEELHAKQFEKHQNKTKHQEKEAVPRRTAVPNFRRNNSSSAWTGGIPIKHKIYGDGVMYLKGRGQQAHLKFGDREYDSTIAELQNDDNYYSE